MVLDFVLPTLEDIYGYMEAMDVNSSSCVMGVSAEMCRTI